MFAMKFAAAALLSIAAANAPTEGGGVKEGDRPSYSFSQPLVNGRGVKSLADLRGRPVVIDFWGTRCPPCVGTAVPAAIKMQEEFGDDVQVILVESQGSNLEQVQKFAIGKKWASENAIWTTEAPLSTGKSWIPCCVLLGNDGEVLLNDSPISKHSDLERLISEQLKLAKKGPKELGPICAKAWAEFEKGSYAVAFATLEGAAQGAESESADRLAANWSSRIKAKLARLDWAMSNAEFEQADALAAQLTKGLAGHALEEKAGELAAKLASDEMKVEREAAKAFAKIEKTLAKDGADANVAKPVAAIVEKFPGTAAAKRAAELQKVMAIALE
ncbi:MAG: TlpA family protein disulfide reductase [Planctomycetes bacterium]|nr:TlpA family protein disulfide reductase [Planctomycetota bacterium]